MTVGATILGCASTRLSEEEKRFFRDADPLGFILFALNLETPDQVRALVGALRETIGRGDAPVLIDQEGGRVVRLKPPFWYAAPAAAVFADLQAEDPAAGAEALKLNAQLIAADLLDLGIDVNCTPVADVPVAGAHDVIGDRAYGSSPDRVAQLARIVARTLLDAGVIPVVKHIPGHGRALADSHRELPVVDAPVDLLRRTDFAPFSALADLPWAMTAHVIYAALDATAPATLSELMVSTIIRTQIGFQGLLLSDDLSMQALEGPLERRARQCRIAGCDIALHCNGVMEEMIQVVDGAGQMNDAGLKRVEAGRAMLGTLDDFDREAARARVAALLERRADAGRYTG
ncbi:MAG: beta-N-acetylhexosaminidase [Rhodospirillaceae bacterium]|nr:beta-N-acetylhexosaminidase [Rhodospirillaceae bacterium]